MSRLLYRIGHFSGRHPWRVILTWIAIAAAAFLLNQSYGGTADETFKLPGVESQKAAEALEDKFPQETVSTSNIIFHSDQDLTRPDVRAAMAKARTDLAAIPHVVAVSDPYDARGPTLSEDAQTGFTTLAFDTTDKNTAAQADAADRATEPLRAAGVQVEYDGGLGYAKTAEEGGISSEMIGVACAVVILALAFGSLVAMSLPVVVALVAILIGFSAIGLVSGVMAVPEITTIVAMMLGLGVGIDYALFILTRHRQNLANGMPVPEAVGRANATAGLSVLFAGVTVIVAITGLQLSGIRMLTVIGWGSALMVTVTLLAALTLLPALLGLAGRRVNSLRIPFVKPKPAYNPRSKSSRWSAKVVAQPIRYGIAAVVLLGALAVPVFSMHLGFPDAGNDASTSTTRKSYDLLAEGFGPGVNGPLQVVIEMNGTAPAAIDGVGQALKDDPGIASVDAVAFSPQGDLASFGVTPTTSPQNAKTGELVDRLRQDLLPDALSGTEDNPMVTGTTAMEADLSAQLQERMLWFLGAVIGLSFVILLIVFRSILVPLKAALLNILSIAASYGVLVAVFQWGWGAGLIGLDGSVPIMPLAPMLMFAVLFGLSMDYEVFLLSRVREQFQRHGDAKAAVVEGVGSTARVITSAALIMIAVFGAFVLNDEATTKLFGVGLSVAVILDVTLVRMVLVPAAMSLLGRHAWWLPRRLHRILPDIHLEGDDADDLLLPTPVPPPDLAATAPGAG
ncbi:MMPL family transporter [Streptomyces sp. NBC_00140]|uniref:MMPL family transporter n=1 Tax=Streptomyces sp. NBC_00140 TaxID=2975664 RepID=UPI0022574355|nr:MMPL family transporter [Streptomyces sp. NBC_00140]MCX5330517.1 MMPL family transporter [Streptomyces sp. NBC_00140]